VTDEGRAACVSRRPLPGAGQGHALPGVRGVIPTAADIVVGRPEPSPASMVPNSASTFRCADTVDWPTSTRADDLADIHQQALPRQQRHNLDPGWISQRPEPAHGVEIFMSVYMLPERREAGAMTRRPPPITQPEVQACCPPIGAQLLPGPGARQLSRQFAALADPVRLRILSVLATAPDGAVCACDLVDRSARASRSSPITSRSSRRPGSSGPSAIARTAGTRSCLPPLTPCVRSCPRLAIGRCGSWR
jgi:hypothetical protein